MEIEYGYNIERQAWIVKINGEEVGEFYCEADVLEFLASLP
jgi:hypothetical protein